MTIHSRRTSLAAGLFVLAAGLCAAVTASSAPPATSASGSPSAAPSGTASAAPSGTAAAVAALPEVRGADIPAERSAPPTKEEWAAGKQVRAHRVVAAPCKFKVVREWLRMECADFIGGSLVGGDPADVSIFAGGGAFVPPDPDAPASTFDPIARTSPPAKTSITMRLSRGDTRVFSLLMALQDYHPLPVEMGYIAVTWPAHRGDPLILSSGGDP